MRRKEQPIEITIWVDKDGKLLDHINYNQEGVKWYTSGLEHYKELKRAVNNPIYKSAITGEIIQDYERKD